MKSRKILFRRFMAMGLALVMTITSQNLSGITVAANDDNIVFKSDMCYYTSDVELPDNDELFEGYAYKEFYGEIATYGRSAREQLEGNAKNIYDVLKGNIEKVASGKLSSTVFDIGNDIDENCMLTYTNVTASEAQSNFEADMALILDALLADCPYDLYWFDKTSGWAYNVMATDISKNGDIYTSISLYIGDLTMQVAGNYQPATYNANNPTVDTTKTSATSTAVANAKAIVEVNKDEDDYKKLENYKNAICGLVTYDTAAATSNNFSVDNDPWQLINVFDKDTSTNVVCEGYSKAFQYLCDITEFEDDITSYLVTGTLSGGTGSGAHMWNIVRMDDRFYYLVDVTNSDAGSVGEDGELFIVTTDSGNVTDGYTFTVNSNNVTYKYDTDTLELWGTSGILTLSWMNYLYIPSGTVYNLQVGDVRVVKNGVNRIYKLVNGIEEATSLPTGVTYDHNTATLTLKNSTINRTTDGESLIGIYVQGDLQIVIEGDNKLEYSSTLDSLYRVEGLYIEGDLTISGTGNLTVDMSGLKISRENCAIVVQDNFIINGGSINLTTADLIGDMDEDSLLSDNTAVYVGKNLEVNNGILNITAGDSPYGNTYGIFAIKNMLVGSSATVNVVAGDAENSTGIYAQNNITSSGIINAQASKATEDYSTGIYGQTIDINGGTVKSVSGEAISESTGIECDSITINNAEVQAKSQISSQEGSEASDFYRNDIIAANNSLIIVNELDESYYSTYTDSIIISEKNKTITVYGNATLPRDLALDSAYTFDFKGNATLSLGDYIISLNSGTIADTALAKIDEVAMVTLSDGTVYYYSNIGKALEKAAGNNGSTLKLLDNISNKTIGISGNADFTIDLNGYEIKNSSQENVLTIGENSSVDITDSSANATGKISNTVSNAGTLTVKGGTINKITNTSTLYIEDGQINNLTNTSTLYIEDGQINNLTNTSTLYIEGGQITNLTNSSVLHITSGTMEDVTSTGTTYIKGNPVISKLNFENTSQSYINGALTDGADITYTGDLGEFMKPDSGYTITASDVAKFTHSNEDYEIAKNSAGNLQVYAGIAGATVSVDTPDVDYNATEHTPDVTVVIEGETLVAGTDYEVSYSDNKNAGEATITITGKGEYQGTKTAHFNINAKKITVSDIVIKSKQYDGKDTATIEDINVSGIIAADDVDLDYSGMTARFVSSAAGADIDVVLAGTINLTGDDKDNYTIAAPTAAKGTIYNNYEAAQGVDYTVNSNDWIKDKFIITAKSGYEISKTNSADDANWTSTLETSEEGTGSIRFYVRNTQTGAISLEKTENYKIDKTAPTGYIMISNALSWNNLSFSDSFKYFFNSNKQVTVGTNDTASGIDKVEYYLSDKVLTDTTLSQVSWKEYQNAFEIKQNSKQYIYARLTDNAGNTGYVGSDGVVIYTDAEAVTTELEYTKKSDADAVITVNLNDNTINELYLVNGENEEKVNIANYSISGNKITIKSEYLDEMADGAYTFRISYNPFGMMYVADSKNTEPAKTEFEIEVKKNTGTVEITNADALDYKFGTNQVVAEYEADSTGKATFEYKAKGAADSAYTTTVPVNAGEYTVRVTVAADNYYTLSSDTADFEIKKADKLVVADVYKDYIRTIETTNNTVDISALLKADKGTTTYTIKSADNEYIKNVTVDTNGVVKYDTLTADEAVLQNIIVEAVMENYETSEVKIAVTLTEKTEVTITGVEAATGLVYNGNVQKGYTGTPASEYSGEYVITYAKSNFVARAITEVQPIDAGDYTVTIAVPESNLYYKGSITLAFTIEKAVPTIDDLDYDMPEDVVYDGQAHGIDVTADNSEVGAITVYYKADGDWTTTAPVNAGEYIVAVDFTETDNYKSASKVQIAEFAINKKDISNAEVTYGDTEYTYDGETHTVEVISVMLDGSAFDTANYTVAGSTQTDAGEYEVTITAKGNYTGTITKKWTIKAKQIEEFEVTLDEDDSYVYNGQEQEKEVLEVVVDGKKLDESQYEVVGNKQKESGEYVIIVNLKGNYSGTVEIPWTITKAGKVSDVASNMIPASEDEVPYIAETVSDVELPEGWVWAEDSKDIKLEVGKSVTVTAVYMGPDKDNYENTTMTIVLTRTEAEADDENSDGNGSEGTSKDENSGGNKSDGTSDDKNSGNNSEDNKSDEEDSASNKETNKKPLTGDNNNMVAWLYILVISGMGIGVLVRTKKKNTE